MIYDDEYPEFRHANGYHGSSKNCCIYCGEDDANESEVCPVREAEIEDEQEKEKKFRHDLKNFYKSCNRHDRKLLRELCDKLDEDPLER